jgi:hypothetical protein
VELQTNPVLIFKISSEAIKNSTFEICSTCDGCKDIALSKMYSELKWANLFDNAMFPVFAGIVAVWSTLYFEVWKRYSARLLFKWDMTDYAIEIEPARPEFIKKVKKYNITKRNYVTDEDEYVPKTWKSYTTSIISYSTVLLFVSFWHFSIFQQFLFR